MKLIFTNLFFLMALNVFAQSNSLPGLNFIKTNELKKDLYEFADANFKGRSAGTLDELKAAAWLAEKYRAIGIKPAGDDGTYFQYFTLWRNFVTPQSTFYLDEKPLALWKDIAVSQMANIKIDAPVLYLGNVLDLENSLPDVKGKVVAVEANKRDINLNISLPTWRYSRAIYTKYGLPLLQKGAVGIIFIADETAEQAWDDADENFKRGTYDIEGGVNENLSTTVPVLWLHANMKNALQQNKAILKANIIVSKYDYPSVNVVGKIDGTDSKLKSEYLLYSGHTDAHGIRNEIKNDSIFYGADDNGSVNVAILANARAFVKYPAKRSILFVIHGAEERGLLGSKYYSQHATVPIKSIVAVLNGDMIGRNNIDSATILGSIPPHRNSVDLVNMAFAANKEGPNFKLDSSWDKVTHVEGWYFRSDHLPYARLGIPAIMYTTLLHPDYHTPQDNAQNINYAKLKKMTDWMYRTGYKVANAATRPATDKNFKLEK
jgi:hypothetical protein